jgi:hypothetical protein
MLALSMLGAIQRGSEPCLSRTFAFKTFMKESGNEARDTLRDTPPCPQPIDIQ